MKKQVIVAVILCLVAGMQVSASQLRIYSLRPACFEYKFTSIVTQSPKPIFSLNHLNGRTHFVSVGDQLGPYSVHSYKGGTKRIYKKSINSYQQVKTGQLVLRTSNGKLIRLNLNETAPQEGSMVGLISLENGKKQFARKKDSLVLGGRSYSIVDIGKNNARVSCNGQLQSVSMITDTESAALKIMLAERNRRQQKAAMLAKAQKQEQAQRFERVVNSMSLIRQQPQRPKTVTVQVCSQPRFFYGYDYPCPTDYRAYGIRSRHSSGIYGHSPILVPTRFHRHRSGFSISYCR